MTTVETERKPMTLLEWLTAAGFVLAIYVVIGLFWADRQTVNVDAIGIERLLTYGGHVAGWPILVFTDLDVFGLHLT